MISDAERRRKTVFQYEADTYLALFAIAGYSGFTSTLNNGQIGVSIEWAKGDIVTYVDTLSARSGLCAAEQFTRSLFDQDQSIQLSAF
jgi:hypothetical protein